MYVHAPLCTSAVTPPSHMYVHVHAPLCQHVRTVIPLIYYYLSPHTKTCIPSHAYVRISHRNPLILTIISLSHNHNCNHYTWTLICSHQMPYSLMPVHAPSHMPLTCTCTLACTHVIILSQNYFSHYIYMYLQISVVSCTLHQINPRLIPCHCPLTCVSNNTLFQSCVCLSL